MIDRMPCLPARATIEQLELQVSERIAADPDLPFEGARAVVAELFDFETWETMCATITRRWVLNRCDVARARAGIERPVMGDR